MAYYRFLFSKSFVRVLLSVFFYVLVFLGYYAFFPHGKAVTLDLVQNFNYTTVDEVVFFALMNASFALVSFGITIFIGLFVVPPTVARKPRLAEITLDRPAPKKEAPKPAVSQAEPVVSSLAKPKIEVPAEAIKIPAGMQAAPKRKTVSHPAIKPHPNKRVIQF